MKTLITFLLSGFSIISTAQPNITGAWQAGTDENQMVMIVADKFYSVAVYNKKDKNYIGTYGGVFRIKKAGFSGLKKMNSFS